MGEITIARHEAECSRRSTAARRPADFLANYVRQKSVNPGRATAEEPGDTRAAQEWLRDQLDGFGCFDELDLWDGAPEQPNLAAVVRGRWRRRAAADVQRPHRHGAGQPRAARRVARRRPLERAYRRRQALRPRRDRHEGRQRRLRLGRPQPRPGRVPPGRRPVSSPTASARRRARPRSAP